MDPGSEAITVGNVITGVLGLIVNIIIIIACYQIAENKGRSGVLGAIAGCLCGCWALLVYLLLPDISHRRDEPWMTSGGTYGGANPTLPEPPGARCWSCNATNPANANVCQTCGSKLRY